MVRVRGIFQSYDAFHKRDNKKARSLDKVPKLRAFPARSYLSDNCFWLREPDLNWRPPGYEGFISHFWYISDIRKSYNNGDIALFFYFDVCQLTHCVHYIGVSFGVKKRIIFWSVRSYKYDASPYRSLYQPKELHRYNSASNPNNLSF